MRSLVIRFLLWLATKLGHESDLDYRGRLLNVVRRRHAIGSRAAFEDMITATSPAGMAPSFEWKGDGSVIVRFGGRRR